MRVVAALDSLHWPIYQWVDFTVTPPEPRAASGSPMPSRGSMWGGLKARLPMRAARFLLLTFLLFLS